MVVYSHNNGSLRRFNYDRLLWVLFLITTLIFAGLALRNSQPMHCQEYIEDFENNITYCKVRIT